MLDSTSSLTRSQPPASRARRRVRTASSPVKQPAVLGRKVKRSGFTIVDQHRLAGVGQVHPAQRHGDDLRAGRLGRSRQASLQVIFMTQSLERAGDHAKNLAEEVCHLVSGHPARHVLIAYDKPIEQMFIEHLRSRDDKP